MKTLVLKQVKSIHGNKCFKSGQKCFSEIEDIIYLCSKDFEAFAPIRKDITIKIEKGL